MKHAQQTESGQSGRAQPASSRAGTAFSLVRFVADIMAVAAVYVIGITAAGLVSWVGEALGYGGVSLTIAAYIAGGLAMIGGLAVMMKIAGIGRRDILLFKPEFKDVGYGLLGYGMYFLIAVVGMTILRVIFPDLDLNQAQDTGLDGVSDALLPGVFLAIVIITPIAEELLFRGFLYRRLVTNTVAPWLAAVFTSFLFGLVHGQVNVMIDTFILSMVTIYVLSIRRNIWTAIIIHAIKNAVAFAGLFLLKLP